MFKKVNGVKYLGMDGVFPYKKKSSRNTWANKAITMHIWFA